MGLGDKPKYDFYTIIIYLILVFIGWLSIYSVVQLGYNNTNWDAGKLYSNQLTWIALSAILIVFIVSIDVKIYQRFAPIFYLISLLMLLGLFVFGKEINGAKSWYSIGNMTLQPTEFAKAATALAVAKFLSGINVSVHNLRDLLLIALIIALPALIILPQPDPGSALVYGAFFFALYRQGLSLWYLSLIVVVIAVFLSALSIGVLYTGLILIVFVFLLYTLSRKRNHKKRLPKPKIALYIIVAIVGMLYTVSVPILFNNVLEDRHRNRINILIGKVEDTQGVGYNIRQSLIAIGSGGFTGKGFLKGTQTQGEFVPEQETDYIFSAISEEWGFMGSALVVVLYVLLVYRVIYLAERQKNLFARVYGHCVAGIFFVHFFINIGMVLGLLPTIGIPLPFMSYGGSGLWGFTILLFIFIKLDAHRMSYDH